MYSLVDTLFVGDAQAVRPPAPPEHPPITRLAVDAVLVLIVNAGIGDVSVCDYDTIVRVASRYCE